MMRRPPDPETFNLAVWTITKQIPPGCVSTYGQIASMIPPPPGIEADDYKRLGAIWVGQSLNETPDDQGITWQRVINSKGGISVPGAAGLRQRSLLEDEGVSFDTKGNVDLQQYGWDGPNADWLTQHNLHPPIAIRRPGDRPQQLSLF